MQKHTNSKIQQLIDDIDDAYLNLRLDEFNEKNEQLLQYATSHKDSYALHIYKYNQANTLFDNNDFDSCEEQMKQLIPYFKEHEAYLYLLRCYNVLAIIESERAFYYESLGYYILALQISKRHPKLSYSAILSNNIGNLFVWLNEHERALTYLLDAYRYYEAEDLNKPSIKAIITINIVECYGCMHKYEESHQWYQTENEYTKPAICVLDNLILANRIEQQYLAKHFEHLPELYDKIMRNVLQYDEYIYHFRTLIRALKVSLDTNNREYAQRFITLMDQLNSDTMISTFIYDFTELKMRYYLMYRHLNDEDYTQYINDYYEQSSKSFHLLRKTYAQSMVLRLDLEKTRDEQKNVIDQNKILEKDLELDPFTKLYNKSAIKRNSIKQMQCLAPSTCHALFIIDIDYFKNVNDQFGHKVGDEVLLMVSDLLNDLANEEILVGRFGGDEFIVFYSNYKKEAHLLSLANTLVQRAKSILIPTSLNETISFSIGIDTCIGFKDFEALFFNADKALYDCKHNGRDGYSIFKE